MRRCYCKTAVASTTTTTILPRETLLLVLRRFRLEHAEGFSTAAGLGGSRSQGFGGSGFQGHREQQQQKEQQRHWYELQTRNYLAVGTSCRNSSCRIDTETSENDIESDSVDEHQCQIWQAHCANTCRPCIFINRKKDGCRKGNLCSHCHFCTPAESKRRRNRLCSERRQAAKN